MAKLHDPSSAKLGFSRRQFLAGAAAGAGVLAIPGVGRTAAAADLWLSGADAPRGFWNQVAVRLKDDRILVGGGVDETFASDPSFYLYDLATDAWTPRGFVPDLPMGAVDIGLQAALIADGQVLVTCGAGLGVESRKSFLYDAASNTWTQTGDLPPGAWSTFNMKAATLDNGRVLVVNGVEALFVYQDTSRKAALYDPAKSTWMATGLMSEGHAFAQSVPIPGNRAFICGGQSKFDAGGYSARRQSRLAEIFDARTSAWIRAADMPAIPGEDDHNLPPFDDQGNPNPIAGIDGARSFHGTIAVKSKIVCVGGYNTTDNEGVFDPINGRFYYGRASIIIYDAEAAAWKISAAVMPYAVDNPLLYQLDDTRVLIAGGFRWDNFVDSYHCFIYDIEADSLTQTADLPNAPVSWTTLDNMPLSSPYAQGPAAVTIRRNVAFHAGGFLEDFSFGPGPHCEVLGASSLRGSPVHKGLGHLQRQQLRSAYRAHWLATVPDQYRYIPRF
jgi:hypothetical protein